MLDKLNDKEREFLNNAIKSGAKASDTKMTLDELINLDKKDE